MISFTCLGCQAKLRVGDEKAGKRGKCPRCGHAIEVPFPELRLEGEEDLPEASPHSSVSPSAPAGTATPQSLDCPSCHGQLPARARICTRCGIRVPSGRPVLIARGIDEDELEVRGEKALRGVSWLVPCGLYPIYSEAGGKHRPYVTWAVALATIVVSLWFIAARFGDARGSISNMKYMLWPQATEHAAAENKRLLALAEIDSEVGQFHSYQLLTHVFLHGGLLHLAGNMLFLMVFGARVNGAIGNLPMLVLYPLLGVVAGSEAFFPTDNPVPMIGASGAIMGLAGIYLVLFPIHRVYMAAWWRLGLLMGFRLSYKIFAVRGLWVVLAYIALDVVLVTLRAKDGVAHGAHIGGFIAGVVIGLALLASRLTYSGSDVLSLILGRHAWPLLGKPVDRLPRLPISAR
jgi:membrane associated rhomboid family serine protease